MRKIYGVNFIESVNQSVTCLLVDKAVVIANPSPTFGYRNQRNICKNYTPFVSRCKSF
jgi:hypothetical protein